MRVDHLNVYKSPTVIVTNAIDDEIAYCDINFHFRHLILTFEMHVFHFHPESEISWTIYVACIVTFMYRPFFIPIIS